MDRIEDRIRARARELGFDAVGICEARARGKDREALARFLKAGLHGDMDWMERTAARRADPRVLWPEAESVVVVGLSYAPGADPLVAQSRRTEGAVSVYARGDDYHDVLKKLLKALASWIAAELGGEVKVFVDTAPVMEKPLAARAGIGWQGKHTNLLSRRFGSWLFLGEVFTTLALASDSPAVDHCGSCDRCRAACPTAALPEPYRIDPLRCISYLTIEHKGAIAPDLRAAIGNRIFGCDDCLAVCPWNKFAAPADAPAFLPRAASASLADLVAMDEATFRRTFRGSPVRRLGQTRFLRNVLIAIGNSGEAALAGAAATRLDDPSALVRAAAVWALARLAPATALAALAARHRPGEADAAVLAEWEAALGVGAGAD